MSINYCASPMHHFAKEVTLQRAADKMKECWRRTEQGDSPFTLDEMWGAFRSAMVRRERQKSEDDEVQRRQVELAANLVSQL